MPKPPEATSNLQVEYMPTDPTGADDRSPTGS